MEKQLRVDPKGHSLLSAEELRNTKGGSITETLVKLVMSGMDYFFRMGVREAKRMKAQL